MVLHFSTTRKFPYISHFSTMGVHSKIIRRSQFMLSTKVYFVLKMYFHILRILYSMILDAILTIVIVFSILIHSLLSIICVTLSLLFNKCCCQFCKTCRTCRDMSSLLMMNIFDTAILISSPTKRKSPNS